MNKRIIKGTKVRVLTTNGGDTTAVLLEDYVPTYRAFLTHPEHAAGNYFGIAPERIKSIEVVQDDPFAEFDRPPMSYEELQAEQALRGPVAALPDHYNLFDPA